MKIKRANQVLTEVYGITLRCYTLYLQSSNDAR